VRQWIVGVEARLEDQLPVVALDGFAGDRDSGDRGNLAEASGEGCYPRL